MNHNPTVLSRPVDNTGGTQQPQYAYEPYRVPTPVLGSGNGNSRDTFGRREEVVEMPAGPGKGERGYF